MLKLNLARNSLRYIIRAYGIKEIFIPYFSCDSLWKAAREEGCYVKFYHVDMNMRPVCEFPQNSFILYINYFGLCTDKCLELAGMYQNLIVDNTQAFYCEHIGLASFNSLRKFFKVQNGSYLYCKKELPDVFECDSLYLEPVFMHENYNHFVENELILNTETEIKYMSADVENYMHNVDFTFAKNIRRSLYEQYGTAFDKFNLLELSLGDSVPYCYPFKTNDEEFLKKLESGKFILLKLWDNNPKQAQDSDVIAFPLGD